jgi:hypothetical protein
MQKDSIFKRIANDPIFEDAPLSPNFWLAVYELDKYIETSIYSQREEFNVLISHAICKVVEDALSTR